MHVAVEGYMLYDWRVATARLGYVTPTGRFTIQWMARRHYSNEYTYWNRRKRERLPAPMNDALFFAAGTAIHAGSVHERSHGCVHLAPENARKLYGIVQEFGESSTVVIVR